MRMLVVLCFFVLFCESLVTIWSQNNMQKKSKQELVKRLVGRPKKEFKEPKIKIPQKMGRPTKYNHKVADYILMELIKGKSLTHICIKEKVPCLSVVYSWLNPKSKYFHADFSKSYIVARELQADTLADQVIDIADDGRNDTYTKINSRTGELETVVDYDNVRRSRLRFDALKWQAAHLLPRKYSARMQVADRDDQALISATTTVIVNFIKN